MDGLVSYTRVKLYPRKGWLAETASAIIAHPLVVLVVICAGLGPTIAIGKVYLYHFIVGFGFLINPLKGVKTRVFYRWYIVIVIIFAWSILTPSFWKEPTSVLIYLVPILSGLAGTILLCFKIRSISALKAAIGSLVAIEIANALFGYLEIYDIYYLPVRKIWSQESNLLFVAIWQQLPIGFSYNPNQFGVTMLILLAFCVAWFQTRKKGLKISILGMILLVMYILLRSGSRGAMIGAAVVFLSILIWWKRRKRLQMAFLAMLFLGGVLGIQFYVKSLSQSIFEKLSPGFSKNLVILYYPQTDLFSSGSSYAIRSDYGFQALEALKKTWGVGLGPGGLISLHNLYFEVLANAGVVGIISILLLFRWLILRSFRLSKLHPSLLGTIGLGCFLFWTGYSIAVISLSTATYFLPMYMMLGISVSAFNLQTVEAIEELGSKSQQAFSGNPKKTKRLER